MVSSFVLGLSLALGSSFQEPGQARERSCVVVDEQGKPAAGVQVFKGWLFPDPGGAKKDERPGPMFPDDRLREPRVTDEQGACVWPADLKGVAFALDLAGGRGALGAVPEDADGAIRLTLRPLVEVRVRYEVKAVGEPPKTCALWAMAAGGMPSFPAACFSESRELRLRLPPGQYSLWYSTDAENLYSMMQLDDGELALPAGSGPIDLGVRVLEIPLIAHPRGVVLDAAGKPVAHPRVGESWISDDDHTSATGNAETDEQGAFRCNVAVYDEERPQALVASTPDGEQGAWLAWSAKTLAPELTLRLAPMVRVHGRLVVEGTEKAVPWTNVCVYTVPEKLRVLECRSTRSRFDFRLPPGRYRMNAYGQGVEGVDLDLELASGVPDLDLATIGLEQDVLSGLVGKPAPAWNLTAARGLERTAQLSDFKGKWVLLEFWGFW